MAAYPGYIQRMLKQAREQGQWYCGQADAAAICFEALTLFPEHAEAAELVYQLFCDEWLIYDTRNALQQQIDEWDDRPWQQRRRMALSLRFLSRWDGWYADDELPGRTGRRTRAGDATDLLSEGRGLLLEAYCLGDEECTDLAWPVFVEAVRRASDPQATLLWIGRLYADLGFFADAAEVLAELCGRFDDAGARRLLAEVRWWRDNAHRLPWLPPPGDGARYRRMMAYIDPAAPDDATTIRELRARLATRRASAPSAALPTTPALDPALARQIAAAMPADAPQPTAHLLVDWGFLDADDGRPGDLPEWAKRNLQLFGDMLPDDLVQRYRWSRPIPKPATPPRYDPNDPPIELDNDLMT